jgi:hypothetical protein
MFGNNRVSLPATDFVYGYGHPRKRWKLAEWILTVMLIAMGLISGARSLFELSAICKWNEKAVFTDNSKAFASKITDPQRLLALA